MPTRVPLHTLFDFLQICIIEAITLWLYSTPEYQIPYAVEAKLCLLTCYVFFLYPGLIQWAALGAAAGIEPMEYHSTAIAVMYLSVKLAIRWKDYRSKYYTT